MIMTFVTSLLSPIYSSLDHRLVDHIHWNMHNKYLMKRASTGCIKRMVSKQSTCLFCLWIQPHWKCNYGYCFSEVYNTCKTVLHSEALQLFNSSAVFTLIWFLRAKAAMLSACLSHRNSVCLSVRPSICLSHGWIRQKRCKLGSPNLHRRLPGRL